MVKIDFMISELALTLLNIVRKKKAQILMMNSVSPQVLSSKWKHSEKALSQYSH